MINSNVINNRQNYDQNLKIQFAARKYFNGAEKINYLSWALCLLSVFMIFIPDGTNELISIGLPVLLDIAAFFVMLIFNNRLKNAAELRNYFDYQVLMIKEGSYTKTNIQKIKELALSIYQKNQSEAAISIRNTGRDNPPGVRNWYEFKNSVDGINAQFECQRQNIWWNKKMIKNRRVCLAIFFVALLTASVLLFFLFEIDALKIFACLAGIILKTIERFIEYKKYYDTSIKIEAIQEHIETHLTQDGIEDLQKLINERRSIHVLEINFIHKKKAKQYSTSYEETS